MLKTKGTRGRGSPRSTRRRCTVAGIVILILFLAGCANGLPSQTVNTANGLKTRIAAVKAEIGKAQAAFNARLAQSDASFMTPYKGQVEAGKFEAATAAQTQAASVYNQQLAPKVKDNKPEDLSQVNALITQINRLLATAELDARLPGQRASAIVQTQANASTVADQAKAAVANINGNDDQLTATGDAQAKKYPAATIDQHLAHAHAWRVSADTAYKAMTAALAASPVNYATVYDTSTVIQTDAQLSTTGTPVLLTDLANLDHTVTRTLTDLGLKCGVGVQRDSWDDSQDYPDEHLFTYPTVNITSAQECSSWFNFDNSSSDGTFAAMDSDFWGGGPGGIHATDEGKFPLAHWTTLHLNPNENWPGGDSAAEFYVNSLTATYSIQVTEAVDGTITRTYWQVVSADTFANISNNLGMDIYEKPVGKFPDEATQVAAPAGAAYVGNPHYGTWHTDNTGQSFWAWYGQYAFFQRMLGGPFYMNQYNQWNNGYRGHRPYYGTYGGHQRFGTGAAYIAASFPRSGFVHSGGLHSLSTIRGAGPADRGRGPGGGGK